MKTANGKANKDDVAWIYFPKKKDKTAKSKAKYAS